MAEATMGTYGYRLPKSKVALPDKGEVRGGAGAGSRPIGEEGETRNALGAQYARGRVLIPNLEINGGGRKNRLHDNPSSRKI